MQAAAAADRPDSSEATTIVAIRRLSFGRSGRLDWIGLKVGQTDRPHERLATVDCADAKADVDASEAELELQRLKLIPGSRTPDPDDLEIAKNRLELAELDLAMALATRKRFASLLERSGGVSQRDLETADRGVAASRLGVTLARKSLESLGKPLTAEERQQHAAEERVLLAKVTRARYFVSLCEIASPIEGTVVAVHYAVGERVQSEADVIEVAEALE